MSGVPQGSHLGPFLFSLFINDVNNYIKGKFLLFADDVKIYKEISSEKNALELQEDLWNIEEWCQANEMELNPTKCVVITFARKKQVLTHDYILQDVYLARVNRVKDLGVYLTPNLDPGEHIRNICCRANRILGLIFRASRLGISNSSIRTLYLALVRPVLEYSVIVWAPYQVGHCLELERVQKRLLRMVGVRLGYRYLDVDVGAIRLLLQLPSLATRRTLLDLVFLYKLLNGQIDCSDILRLVDLHVSRGTRHHQLFTRHQYPTSYSYHSTIPRLLRTGNLVCADLDFLGPPIHVFKKSVLALLQHLSA